MTEYTYTDRNGDRLTVYASRAADGPVVFITTIAAGPGPEVPTAELPDVIRGILAQAAAATGHDAADPLAHIRADLDAYQGTPDSLNDDDLAAFTDAWNAASERLHDGGGLRLLYALGAAYLGDDAPIWGEIRRVQRERDTARREADRARNDLRCALQGAAELRADLKEERAEVDRLRAETKRLRTAWHSARGRAAKWRGAAQFAHRAWHSAKDQARELRGQRNEARAELDAIEAAREQQTA